MLEVVLIGFYFIFKTSIILEHWFPTETLRSGSWELRKKDFSSIPSSVLQKWMLPHGPPERICVSLGSPFSALAGSQWGSMHSGDTSPQTTRENGGIDCPLLVLPVSCQASAPQQTTMCCLHLVKCWLLLYMVSVLCLLWLPGGAGGFS